MTKKKGQRFHIALSVENVDASIADYSHRLGEPPCQSITGEYALWRTETLNLSIRKSTEPPGTLRHLGWEDPTASTFSEDQDCNGITWEHFSADQQQQEIDHLWPTKPNNT